MATPYHPHPVVYIIAIFLLAKVHSQSNTPGYGSVSMVWNPQSYPNPRYNLNPCGISKASWVCDPARNVNRRFDAASRVVSDLETLERIIDQTNQKTKGACSSGNEGYKMTVAIVGRIENTVGSGPAYQQLMADQFAEYLRQVKWKPGSCSNDVVVMLETDTKTIGLSIGGAAASRLSLSDAKALAGQSTSSLRENTNSDIGQELIWLLSKFQNHLMDTDRTYTTYMKFLMAWGIILGVAILISIGMSIFWCIHRVCTGERDTLKDLRKQAELAAIEDERFAHILERSHRHDHSHH